MRISLWLYWLKNWAIMLWWGLWVRLGVKRDASVIPEGPYCYTPDIEKNKKEIEMRGWMMVYRVIPCKYYKTLGDRCNGCSYLGIITDDIIFDDQCKMCGENDNYND